MDPNKRPRLAPDEYSFVEPGLGEEPVLKDEDMIDEACALLEPGVTGEPDVWHDTCGGSSTSQSCPSNIEEKTYQASEVLGTESSFGYQETSCDNLSFCEEPGVAGEPDIWTERDANRDPSILEEDSYNNLLDAEEISENISDAFSEKESPIYAGAPISVHQSMMAILTLALTQNLSGKCIKALLELIFLHLPKTNNIFKKTLYFFKKYFSFVHGPQHYQSYCSICFRMCDGKKACCKTGKVCFLVKLSLLQQLQTLFNRKGFYSKLKSDNSDHVPDIYKDIYDGKVYQDQVKAGFLGQPDRISFQWFTDGASLWDSNNLSVWPMYFTVNELPYCDRFKQQNVLVPVLWVGPVKPPSNILLEAIYSDLAALHQGVALNVMDHGQKLIKALVLCGTADMPARSLMMNMLQFNGESSCQRCEQKGLPRSDNPGVRIFPYAPAQMTPRTLDKSLEYANQAQIVGKAVVGFKGVSMLSKVCPDFVSSTAIDPMHQIYGGVAKKIFQLLTTKDASGKWSVVKHVDLVNARLLSINPPAHFPRAPRSLADISYFKVSELEAFFLHYSLPVFEGIVPDNYLAHHASLVAAVHLLNADVVTSDSLDVASKHLKSYVAQFADFYDIKYMTMNFHLLLHLVDVVRDLGPQFVYTCFPLENINGLILRLVHGTRWAESQIANSVQTVLGLPDMIDKLEECEAKTFCNKAVQHKKYSKEREIRGSIIVGSCKDLTPIPAIVKKLMAENNINFVRVQKFHSLKRGRFFYAAVSNTGSTRRDSTVAAIADDNVSYVGLIEMFLKLVVQVCKEHVSCDCYSEILIVVRKLEIVQSFKTLLPECGVPNVKQYRKSDCILLVPPERLQGTCVKMFISGKLFISKLCNTHEIE